jgi:hypothetical protein
MPHEIETRIAEVRRRARRLMLLYALSWVVAAVVAATLVLGLADYWIHFRDPGIRVLSLLALLAVLVWAAVHYLRPVLARRLDDVAIAQKIERRFPALRDRLSSSVEFLKASPDDRQAGSAALRELVIAQTTAATKDLDLSAVLERRPTRRALAGATLAIALAGAAVLFDPSAARLALARLANPLGSAAWPRQHDLVFRHPPERVAAGQSFEVELVDSRGRQLPDEVRIHYLYDTGGDEIEEVENMHLLGGVMVARKENVTRPFQYRAEGGDDDTMDWSRLEVVEPPRIDSLRATLYPPAYTGWPVEPTENNLHALRGTRVAFSGVASQPLRSATLKQEGGPEFACTVSTDGRRFDLPADASEPFVVDKSGQYWFELEDTDGVIGGQESRWEIRAVTDAPPSVTIERPGASSFVTPAAVVRLRAIAKDDLGVRSMALHFHGAPAAGAAPAANDQKIDGTEKAVAAETAEVEIPLFVAPEADPADKSTAPAGSSLATGMPGDSRVVDYPWDLSKLALTPGSQLTFAVSATDAAGQTGRSPDRRLIVITPQELADRLAQRQELILAELRRVLKVERDAEGQTSRLSIQLREVGHLAKPDIDHAQATELSQRHIARTLTDRNDGIPAQIADLLADLASNQVDSAETAERMEAILSAIERVEREHLAPAERGLTSAIKAAQADLAEATARHETDFGQSPTVAPALAEVDAHQQGVISALEEMLAGLGEWDSYRRFARDVAQLEHDEAELEQATKKLGPELLGKQWKDLEPQQQADLKKLANRQAELGRQFDKLLSAMDDADKKLDQEDPLAGARLSDAAHLARHQGTVGRMRAAGEGLQRNQLGQAANAESQVRKDLSEMLEILTGRHENVLEQLVAKLRQAEQQLAALRLAHQHLRALSSQAMQKPADARTAEDKARLDQLARGQQALQEETERMARRLEQLQADAAGRSTNRAAGEIDAQSKAAQAEDAKGSEEQAEAAQKDLAKAQKQLAERLRQAEADLARQQMNQLEQSLHGWHERQSKILAETARIDGLSSAGQPPAPDPAAARGLAQDQRALETEMRQQTGKLTAAEVFHLALAQAARDMTRAADDLDRGETGTNPQQAEQSAAASLARLLEALQPAKPKPNPEQPGGDEGQGGGGQQPGKRSSASIAELKLLKLMQEDLNARYQQLHQSKPTPRLADQLGELAAEQGRLAELAQKMSQPVEADPAEDAESEPPPTEAPPAPPKGRLGPKENEI